MKRTRKYTRRKIPPGFSIALPRQACPGCRLLIDVRIRKDGQVYFINAGEYEKLQYGGTKGGSSDTDERE